MTEKVFKKILLKDEICRFEVHLPNKFIITLNIRSNDSLSDLHQKINNRLRIHTKNYEHNTSTTVIQIHDVFICNDDSPDVVSIPFDKSIIITDFIELHQKYFQNSLKYTIYVVDQEYYGKWKDQQLGNQTMFTYLTEKIASYMTVV